MSAVPALLFLMLASSAYANGAGEESALLLPVLSRWLHVLGAVILLGGAVFISLVLTPAASATLDAEAQLTLRKAVLQRWRRWAHPLIALLLLSGLYNYYLQMSAHQGDGPYHMLMGIKILLALLLFVLISIAISSKERPKIEANRKTLLLINVVLGIGIVLIAGYLKIR